MAERIVFTPSVGTPAKKISIDNFFLKHSLYISELFSEISNKSEFDEISGHISILGEQKLSELFFVIEEKQIKDVQSIKILCEVSAKLVGKNSLLISGNIRDFLQQILYNRPHFSFEDKVEAILHASKFQQETNIIKYGNLFLNSEANGNIGHNPNQCASESRVLGLYSDDMQFLERFEWVVNDSNDKEIIPILNESQNNNYFSFDENSQGDLKIRRERLINGALFENTNIINTSSCTQKAYLWLSCPIKDVFSVRCKLGDAEKEVCFESTSSNEFIINHKFVSGRSYGISIDIQSDEDMICAEVIDKNEGLIRYEFDIAPNVEKVIKIRIQPLFNKKPFVDGRNVTDTAHTFNEALYLVKNASKFNFPEVKIKNEEAQEVINTSINDINMLTNYLYADGKEYSYIAAGLPRYSALFGRDSIITAMQILRYCPKIAKDTIELLAKFQGKSFEERHKTEIEDIIKTKWPEPSKNYAIRGLKELYLNREEAEGKILHELRVGEFSQIGVIPHSPYYGTVDATPLWLVLIGIYYIHTKDMSIISTLMPSIEAAFGWIENNTVDGYLRFVGCSNSKVKIKNQGWKDAGNSLKHIINSRGYLSEPIAPIALAEVQAYTYKAYMLFSEIFMNFGQSAKAYDCKEKATELKSRFNTDFWLEKNNFYTMALDKDNSAIDNVTSNIGHCLTMGIIKESRIAQLEEKLMSEEMFTGWGIRTLSSKSPAYNPLSYHNGSVWTHDSAFVAKGMTEPNKEKVINALLQTAQQFKEKRLPELFGGFENDGKIELYPEACSPQAWASGSLLWLLDEKDKI